MTRLSLDDVSVAFGGVAALSGVSLAVAPAEIRGVKVRTALARQRSSMSYAALPNPTKAMCSSMGG